MSATKTIGTKLYKLKNTALGEQANLVIANLTSIGAIGMESDEIDVTDLDSPEDYKEFIAGSKTPTDVEISGNIKNETAVQQLLALANSRTVESWMVVYPSGSTWTFNGYIKSFTDGEKTTDGLLTFTSGIRVTGKPTFTPSGVSLARYTVRYYVDNTNGVAINVETPMTTYAVGTVIKQATLESDIGLDWMTKYKPPTYTGTTTSSPVITANAGLTISGNPTLDIIKVLYVNAPLDPLAVVPLPVDGATGIATSSTYKLTFNYKIATCPPPVFVNTDTDEPIAYTSEWNAGGTELTLTPSAPLTAATKYTVTLTGVVDSYNRELAMTSFDFTTA